jgi:hypothetical protein
MLHIVQVVMWGVAEQPLLFSSEEKARAAYVDCVRKAWTQRYDAYCEHHGLDGGSFMSAQAFVHTIDTSEKSAVHLWTATPEGTELDAPQPGTEGIRQVAEGINAVQDWLTRLLAEVAHLADRCARMDAAAGSCEVAETVVSPPATGMEEITEASPETRATAEWQNFVAQIQRSFSNSRNQATLLPRDDWRQDVYSHHTSLEYWDWVADRTKRYRDEAEKAGYAVMAEEGVLGCYRFANRDGIGSEDHYGSEWEAWCAAGLHLKAGGDIP